MVKYNAYEKTANDIRRRMEDYCRRHDGDIFGYFTDGSICGTTEGGDLIVGFGVIGSANIVIAEDCVKFGGYVSKEFSPMLKMALADFLATLENC